jgi:alkaline phosphatase
MNIKLLGAVVGGGLALCGMAAAQENAGPKNVILMIGDGMGFAQMEAASLYEYGELHGQPYWNYQVLGCSTFSATGKGFDPEKAAADFNYVLKDATDSAAGATTLSSGVKTANKAIGVDVNEQPLRHLYEDAEAKGKSTGILTTVYISHATPAGFTTHHPSRNDIDVIAVDMIRNSTVDVLMGAGHPWFDDDGKQVGGIGDDPFKTEGDYKRLGGEELWKEIVAGTVGNDANGDGRPDPWALVDDLEGFKSLTGPNPPSRVLGIAPVATTLQGNRGSDADKKAEQPYAMPSTTTVPDLALMLEGALNVLSKDPEGFFIMAEGGAIDWGGHGNVIGRLIEEQLDFDKAIAAVDAWVAANSSWDETLLIITADHETGYLSGPDSGEKVTPLVSNGKGKTPGYKFHTGGHTNQVVPCIAKGKGAEKLLEAVKGTDALRGPFIDNTDIPKTIRAVWR